jgi:hypothetical protein
MLSPLLGPDIVLVEILSYSLDMNAAGCRPALSSCDSFRLNKPFIAWTPLLSILAPLAFFSVLELLDAGLERNLLRDGEISPDTAAGASIPFPTWAIVPFSGFERVTCFVGVCRRRMASNSASSRVGRIGASFLARAFLVVLERENNPPAFFCLGLASWSW